MEKNKKAQVGEAMTWTVATLIILVLLFLFLFAVGLIAPTRNLLGLGTFVNDESSDFAEQQMSFAISDNYLGGSTIEQLIRSDEKQAKIKIKKILAEFEAEGLKCSFNIVNKQLVLKDCKNV